MPQKAHFHAFWPSRENFIPLPPPRPPAGRTLYRTPSQTRYKTLPTRPHQQPNRYKTLPAHPHQQPNRHKTLPTRPHQQPNRYKTPPTRPHQQPNRYKTLPAHPHQQPNRHKTLPTRPHQQPNRYKTPPTRPHQQPNRYKTLPAHPHQQPNRYKTLPTRTKRPISACFARAGRTLYRRHHQEAEQGELCTAPSAKPGTKLSQRSRSTAVPRKSSPSTPKNGVFRLFRVCRANYFAHKQATSHAGRIISRTGDRTGSADEGRMR